MNFTLNDDQAALRRAAADFLASADSVALARARYADPATVPEELAKALADQGWAGLAVPERCGGLGRGVVELALVMEETGRALLPVPMWCTAALFVPLLVAAGTEEASGRWLSDVAAGQLWASAAVAESSGLWRPDAAETVAEEAAGGGWRLTGAKTLVPEAQAVGALAVTAATPSGTGLFVVDPAAPGTEVRLLRSLDASRALADVVFSGAPAVRVSGEVDAGAAIGQALQVATVALAAELIGTARAALEMTTRYVSVREQFGVPVGAFQAVAHLLADDLLDVERAGAGVYWAAMCVDAEDADTDRAVPIAKASAGDAARRTVKDAVQLHGGVGYTWEHDLHLFLRRVYATEPLLGGATHHRDRLADLLAL
ncbi:MAG: acyl-CoA dehydrogenase family protein [Mycobacteriales bacterium]